MEKILQFLDKNKKDKKISVAVMGDAMIDEYYEAKVKRISPEYPIPIIHMTDNNPVLRPGGAANVVYQFKRFNAQVDLYSLTSENVKLPKKKRYFQDNVQLARIDVEQENYGLDEERLKNHTQKLQQQMVSRPYDAAIFSDYGKGIFKFFNNDCLNKFPITIVDPKNGDISRWKGCTVFKPNQEEALKLSGKSNVRDAGIYLSEYLGASVVITEASKGVSVFEYRSVYEIRPDVSPAVAESVIGAGDCFVAFLTMALCHNFSLKDAAEIAFKAGTLYVLNKRNKPLYPHNLRVSVDSANGKLLDHDDLEFLFDRCYKLVFTNGCFDLMHRGHIESLRFAKQQGDKLIVAINSDESVRKLKPNRPIMSLDDRIAMLTAIEYVDYVVVFDDDTPLELIKKIRPDVVVKGADYKKQDIVGYGIVPEIKRCPLVEGISTTKIIDKIKST